MSWPKHSSPSVPLPFDLSKFEDGYKVAVRALVDAKVNHLPTPQYEVPTVSRGNVISLMDALRKSIGETTSTNAKKPVASVKGQDKKAMGVVKQPAKAALKRKTA